MHVRAARTGVARLTLQKLLIQRRVPPLQMACHLQTGPEGHRKSASTKAGVCNRLTESTRPDAVGTALEGSLWGLILCCHSLEIHTFICALCFVTTEQV